MEFNAGSYTLSISKRHIETMVTYITASGKNETGGILLGYYIPAGNIAVVSEVLGPPDDSRSGSTWFRRGTSGLKALIKKAWSKQEFYIGEWHFHPMGNTTPSAQDYSQMSEIAANHRYYCPEPIMIIIAGTPQKYAVQPYLTIKQYGKTYRMELVY